MKFEKNEIFKILFNGKTAHYHEDINDIAHFSE